MKKHYKILLTLFLFICLGFLPVSAKAKEIRYPVYNSSGKKVTELCGYNGMMGNSYFKYKNGVYTLYGCSPVEYLFEIPPYKLATVKRTYRGKTFDDIIDEFSSEDYPSKYMATYRMDGLSYYSFQHRGITYVLVKKSDAVVLMTTEENIEPELVMTCICNYNVAKKHILKKPVIKSIKHNKKKYVFTFKKQKRAKEYYVCFHYKNKKEFYMESSESNIVNVKKSDIKGAVYYTTFTINDYRTSPRTKYKKFR